MVFISCLCVPLLVLDFLPDSLALVLPSVYVPADVLLAFFSSLDRDLAGSFRGTSSSFSAMTFFGYVLIMPRPSFRGSALMTSCGTPFLRDGSLLSFGTSVYEVEDPICCKASIHILSMHVLAFLNSSSYCTQMSSTSALHLSFFSFEHATYSCPCSSISCCLISFSILSSSNHHFSAVTFHISCCNSWFSASSFFIL